MEKLIKKSNVDVAIVDDKAYWIQQNTLYSAAISENGEILTEEASPVDVINMPKKQLKSIIQIVDSFNK